MFYVHPIGVVPNFHIININIGSISDAPIVHSIEVLLDDSLHILDGRSAHYTPNWKPIESILDLSNW